MGNNSISFTITKFRNEYSNDYDFSIEEAFFLKDEDAHKKLGINPDGKINYPEYTGTVTENRFKRDVTKYLYETTAFENCQMRASFRQNMLQWFNLEHPHYLKRAIEKLNQTGQSLPKLIERELQHLGSLYVFNELKNRENDTKRIKQDFKQAAFQQVCNLIIYAELTLDNACAGVSALLKENYPSVSHFKASTLERLYSEEFRNNGLEKLLTDSASFLSDQERHDTEQLWREIASQLPKPDLETKGERR